MPARGFGRIIGPYSGGPRWRVAESFLPFHVAEIDEEEVAEVTEALRSGWLTTGPRVKRFEQEFAAYVGARHAVALNSGTAALHLALEAIGMGAGDEVIVPTMTFAATAEVVFYCRARPVLADCRRDTLNLDPAEVERRVTERTRAVIPVHMGGQPCEMQALLALAQRHGLKVIEDAAHALPARLRLEDAGAGSGGGDAWRMVGAIGDLTCFSFYATKTLTTGEGGMLVTDDEGWADRVRVMSLHGISKDAWKRYTAEGSWSYEIHAPGYKYNMTDVAAALGLVQLKKCDRMRAARAALARLYTQALADLPEIALPTVLPGVEHAWHLYQIVLNLERLTIGRGEFIERLRQAGIGASVHFIPLHLHPFYRDTLGYRAEEFPNATWLAERIVSLPLYSRMTEGNVGRVVEVVRGILAGARR